MAVYRAYGNEYRAHELATASRRTSDDLTASSKRSQGANGSSTRAPELIDHLLLVQRTQTSEKRCSLR